MKSPKVILFDVANTLLMKPDVYLRIDSVLREYGYDIPMPFLIEKHRLISEAILFPDKTSKTFYQEFNKIFLFSLGIIPDEKMLDTIFERCTYLPWVPFEDTAFLGEIPLPIGILSNWDKSLPEKLKKYFSTHFEPVFCSEIVGYRKPDPMFFHIALQTLQCSPEEVIFVGDSLKLDIETALSMGIRAILVDREGLYPYYKGEKIAHLSELWYLWSN